jgi:hypothetical protein
MVEKEMEGMWKRQQKHCIDASATAEPSNDNKHTAVLVRPASRLPSSAGDAL